ncbi:MAG: hypothetical protein RR034_03630 [Bacteroidales bacterium]
MKMLRGNSFKNIVYLAILTKVSVENSQKAIHRKEFFIQVVNEFLNYCQNPEKKVKINKEIKKVIHYRQLNMLDQYYIELKNGEPNALVYLR